MTKDREPKGAKKGERRESGRVQAIIVVLREGWNPRLQAREYSPNSRKFMLCRALSASMGRFIVFAFLPQEDDGPGPRSSCEVMAKSL
jgi:hypothetical protein